MAEDGDIHDYVRTEVRDSIAEFKEWLNERLKPIDKAVEEMDKVKTDFQSCQTTCKNEIVQIKATQKLVMALCTALGGIGGSIVTYAAVFLIEKHL